MLAYYKGGKCFPLLLCLHHC